MDNMDKLIHNNDFTYYDSTFGIVRWQEKYLITHLIERKPSEAVDDVAELRNRKRSSSFLCKETDEWHVFHLEIRDFIQCDWLLWGMTRVGEAGGWLV